MNNEFLKEQDKEIFDAISNEEKRQRTKLELIASENFTSPSVLEAMGSVMTNKYAEGYPGKRYYGGCEFVDVAENLARDRAKALFKAEHANVQPHCGSQANMVAYFTFLKPGDTFFGLDLSHGGHLTHGHPISFSGMLYNAVHYGVEKESEVIDYANLKAMALEHKPKMIITGASAYPRTLQFDKFREIADSVGAKLVVDMAHIAGLVAAGVHPSPVPYADIVTSTTHKTLRGPRGGLVLSKQDYAAEVDKALFPGIQGGPLMHIIAAKAVAFNEALQPSFIEYQKQVLKNAKALAEELSRLGFRLVSGGTDTHLMLVDLRPKKVTGKAAEKALDRAGITVNKNTIPFDPEKPFVASGIRLGTPALTTRGMKEDEMKRIAGLINRVIENITDEAEIEKVRLEIEEFTSHYELHVK